MHQMCLCPNSLYNCPFPFVLASEQLVKEYVCRVEGEFPQDELVCEQPILVVSFKIGLCRVDPKGKECRTVFQRLDFNGKTSVVRCLPLTGRTHQIRVHLQYLGFPILNDPIYGSSAWGPNRGKGGLVGRSDNELLQALIEEHRTQESLHLLDIPDDGIEKEAEHTRASEKTDKSTSEPEAAEETQMNAQPLTKCASGSETNNIVGGCSDRDTNDSTKSNGGEAKVTESAQDTQQRDHLCSECKLVRPDPTEKELIMYLHALRYKGPDFDYSTRLPDWAKEDWVEDD